MRKLTSFVVMLVVLAIFTPAAAQETQFNGINVWPAGAVKVESGAQDYAGWIFSLSAYGRAIDVRDSLIVTHKGTASQQMSNIRLCLVHLADFPFQVQIVRQVAGPVANVRSDGRIVFVLDQDLYIPQDSIATLAVVYDIAQGAVGTFKFQIKDFWDVRAFEHNTDLSLKLNAHGITYPVIESHSGSTYTTIIGTSEGDLPQPGALSISKGNLAVGTAVASGARVVKALRVIIAATGENEDFPNFYLTFSNRKLGIEQTRIFRNGVFLPYQKVFRVDPNTACIVHKDYGLYEQITAGETVTYDFAIDIVDQNDNPLPAGEQVIIGYLYNSQARGAITGLRPTLTTGYSVYGDVITVVDNEMPPAPELDLGFNKLESPVIIKSGEALNLGVMLAQPAALAAQFSFQCNGSASIAWYKSAQYFEVATDAVNQTFSIIAYVMSLRPMHDLIGTVEVRYPAPGKYSIPWNAQIAVDEFGTVTASDTINVLVVRGGDANADDFVNILDIVAMVRYILGEASTNFQLAAVDFNNDHVVDVSDLIACVRLLLESLGLPDTADTGQSDGGGGGQQTVSTKALAELPGLLRQLAERGLATPAQLEELGRLLRQLTGAGGSSDEGDADGVPSEFRLQQNYPNPFNPATTIAYDVPQQAHVTLTVYNLLGQEVIRLVDGVQEPGRYQVIWHGRDTQDQAVASGVYIYRLTAGGTVMARRMTLLK